MFKRAERNESVDSVSADLRNLVEQVTLINGKPCISDEILGMAIISAFGDDRKYNLAVYNLENNEGTFTPKKVVPRLTAVQTTAKERDQHMPATGDTQNRQSSFVLPRLIIPHN